MKKKKIPAENDVIKDLDSKSITLNRVFFSLLALKMILQEQQKYIPDRSK